MRIKHVGVLVLAALLLFFLGACGGSDDDSDSDDTTEYETGVFLDSPVINIGYRTETLEGVTNSLGEYDYVEGETVTFFIGDLEFPSVTATGTVTPLDMADTDNTADNVVVNILRLLQTLDQDGDPTNGITISDDAEEAAVALDFDVDTTEFEADADVLNLIANGGQDTAVTELISEGQALTNFEDTLAEEDVDFVANATITGTWICTETDDDLLALIFFDDGTYMHFEVDEEAPYDVEGETSGMEAGTFTRDSDTGKLTILTNILDNNGDTGLVDGSADLGKETGASFEVSGDVLTVSADSLGLTFLRADSDGILGTWILEDEEEKDDNLAGFVFLDDSTYIFFDDANDSSDDCPGMEWGTYTWDSSDTGVLTTTQTFDSNGDCGLSDIDGTVTIEIDGDSATVEPGDEGTRTLTRI